MTNQPPAHIQELLEAFSAKISMSPDSFWQSAVQSAHNDAVATLVLWLVAVVSASFFLGRISHIIKARKKTMGDLVTGDTITSRVLLIIVLFIVCGVLLTVPDAKQAIADISAPERVAIERIFEAQREIQAHELSIKKALIAQDMLIEILRQSGEERPIKELID